MSLRRPLLVAVVALLCLGPVAPAALGSANAAPPPEAVCGVCGPGLVEAADRAGLGVTVERGTATIHVSENGTGHWDARVRLDDAGAARLAANATLRERVVRASLDRRTVVDDPRNLHTSVVNDTLVVGFDVRDVAHRSLGSVVLVDLLDPRARRAGLILDADRLRIEGPNGTVVSRAPASATVEDGAVVWRSNDDSPGFRGDTRLAFAPSDDPSARALTTVGFVAFGIGLAEPSALVLGVLPALGLGALLLVLRRWREEVPTVDTSRLGTVITGGSTVAALVAIGSLLGLDVVTPLVAETVLVFGVLYGPVGGLAARRDSSPRLALAWTLLAMVSVATVASTVSITAFQTALLSIPVVLWFPLGRAHGRNQGIAAAVALTMLVAPFGAAVLYAPSTTPLLGLLTSLFTTGPWAAATVAFGLPLYLLGRTPEAATDSMGDSDRRTPATTN